MKNKIKLLILLSTLFLLSGCWNYNELNSLAIATGMAIDKNKDDYEVSFLIANSKKEQSSSTEGESQTIIFTGQGKTITDAMRNIEALSPKKIYISHLSVVILSEEVAKNGLATVNDYLLRNPASIKRFYAIVTDNRKALDILKIISPLESFPSQNIYSNIRVSAASQGISTIIPYGNFVESFMKKGKEAMLPIVTIIGDSKEGSNQESLKNVALPAVLEIKNLALFKGDKLVKKIKNDDESIGINLISNHVQEINVQTDCDKGYINTVLTSISSKTNVSLINNNPKVIIKIKAIGKLNEISCNINLQKVKAIENIEKEIEKKVRQISLRGIKTSQNSKTDIFGFGNLFYKYYPDYFKNIENKWNEKIYPTLNPIIDVKIHLVSKGSTQNTIKEEINEE